MGNNTYVGVKYTEDCDNFPVSSKDRFNLKYVPFSPIHVEMNLYKLPKNKSDKKQKLAVLYTKFQFTRGILIEGTTVLPGQAAYYHSGFHNFPLLKNMDEEKQLLPFITHSSLRYTANMVSALIFSWIKVLRPIFRMKSFEQNLIVTSKLKGKSSGNTFVFYLCGTLVKHVTLSYLDDVDEGWFLIYDEKNKKKAKKYAVQAKIKQKTRTDDLAMLGSVNFVVNAPKEFPTPVVIMSQYIVENMKTQVIAIVIRNAFKKWKENKQSKQKTNKKDD